ncbi:MAG TPA: hypothetical protein VII98_04900 [Solirubrobacteraceae bacterium]
MRSRRLLLVLAVLALTLGVAGALRREGTTSTTTTPLPAAPPAQVGGAEANLVTGTLPADRIVRAKLGDTVRLSVTSDSPDIANMTELGLSSPVGPQIPGTFEFTAYAVGRFPVTLSLAARAAGEVDVSR